MVTPLVSVPIVRIGITTIHHMRSLSRQVRYSGLFRTGSSPCGDACIAPYDTKVAR